MKQEIGTGYYRIRGNEPDGNQVSDLVSKFVEQFKTSLAQSPKRITVVDEIPESPGTSHSDTQSTSE